MMADCLRDVKVSVQFKVYVKSDKSLCTSLMMGNYNTFISHLYSRVE